MRDISNASYGAYSARFDLHYLVDERKMGTVCAWRRAEGIWSRLASAPSQGSGPCFVAINHAETRLAVCNYDSGSLACFKLDPDTGFPLYPLAVHQNSGRGPIRGRQDSPHAHCARFSPDGRWLYQTDLGTDEVLAFPVLEDGLGQPLVAFRAKAGCGPRHILFNSDGSTAFLAGELSSEVIVLNVGDGTLEEQQSISTIPASFAGENLVAHLAISKDGKRIYLSNRGHDSIALFDIDDGQRMKLVGHYACGGEAPRHFLLMETQGEIAIANATSGSVSIMPIRSDGTLGDAFAKIPVPGAAFLIPANPRS